jgi:hypothetical protein
MASRNWFTRRERANRIYRRIYTSTVKGKGLTAKQIARYEHLSLTRTHHYLRLLRGAKAPIQKLDHRFYYVPPREEPARPPQRPLEKGQIELRGYLNYASWRSRGRDIDIDCVIVTYRHRLAILTAKSQIENLVTAKFGRKLAAMLHYGVSEVTPRSANHFLYRHGVGEGWRRF